MRARGFTLLEMMLATVVGAMVILAAVGTLGLVNRTEERLSQGYDDVVELARVQGTLRRGMQSLVAQNPAGFRSAGAQQGGEANGADDDESQEPPDRVTRGAGTGTRRNDDGGDGRARNDGLSQSQRDARDEEDDDEDDDDRGVRGLAGDDEDSGPRPMLDIGPLDPETDEDVHVGDTDWRLEATFSGPPIGPVDPAAGEIRGAFEFIQRGPSDWMVVWRSLEPAEEPIILAENLEYAMLAALTRDNFWTDRLDARAMEDFPRSIRVVLMTRSGRTADWLLEPGVTFGTGR